MTAQPIPEAPARFTRGEPVTVIVNGTADAEYEVLWGARELPVVSLDLPGRPAARVDLAYDRPGITVIHGDIRPTLLQALRDAMDLRDCPEAECIAWHDQYEKAIDVLGAADS